MFLEKDSSHQRNGKNCMESAREMKSTTSNWGKASSSRNMKAKALHLHRSMLTGGNITILMHWKLPYIMDSLMNLEWKWVDWMNMCCTWPHDIYIDVALKRVTLSFQAWLLKTSWMNKIHKTVISSFTCGTCTLINIFRFGLLWHLHDGFIVFSNMVTENKLK